LDLFFPSTPLFFSNPFAEKRIDTSTSVVTGDPNERGRQRRNELREIASRRPAEVESFKR